jgi:hypothetical protein
VIPNAKNLPSQVRLGNQAWEQSQHSFTGDPFYNIPKNFSRSLTPGMILLVEYDTDLANYTVPSSLTMSRIIYTALDLNNTVVPSSAYALWPYNSFKSTSGDSSMPNFPLVGWPHGNTRISPSCGPSTYASLHYHFMVPYHLTIEGLAVIAADFASLGASVSAN